MATSNINTIIDQISSAVHAANRSGIQICAEFQEDHFCCASVEVNLIRTIDLNDKSAPDLLNMLLRDIYAITPANQAMQGAE